MKKILILLIFISGCSSTIELAPGLCYNDSDGTYLCPEREQREKPKLPQQFPPNTLQCELLGLIEYCEGTNEKNLRCQCANPRIYSEIIPIA